MELRVVQLIRFLSLPIVTLLLSPGAHADGALDAKIAQLYQEVSRGFRSEAVQGLPAPKMMDGQLFAIWLKSYCNLLQSDSAGEVSNRNRLSMVDYDLDAKTPRLYLYDVASRRMMLNTWTSHGGGSQYSLYLRISDTDFNIRNTLNESILSYYSPKPLFFSNQEGSAQSSVGMAVVFSKPYESTKIYFGVPQGRSVRMKGVDGKLNDQLVSRATVIHGFDFHINDFSKSGAPNSESCIMLDHQEAQSVMDEMMGSAIVLYHDRMYPELNEKAYQEQRALVARMESQISTNLRSLAAQYGWSSEAVSRNEKRLLAKLAPLRQKIEATYRYFKNDSRFVTFEPRDAEACAKSLGI